MNRYVQSAIKTKFGAIFLVGNDEGIASIWFDQVIGEFQHDNSRLLHPWIRQLDKYFSAGVHPQIPVFLPKATPFQLSVWNAAQEIPLGVIVTYKELASRIARPNAARAVGNALGTNPIPIVIPCHRIVATNSLGGFSGGIGWKQFLLDHEKQFIC